MKKFLLNIYTKSLILTILPLIYPSLFFYALSITSDTSLKENLIGSSVFLAILHIIALFYYGYTENKQSKSLNRLINIKEKSPKEVQASSSLLQKYSKIIRDNADKLYDVIKDKKGHSDIADWQWMRSNGDELCSELHRFIKTIAEKGNEFSVSMMFRMSSNNENGFTMLSRASDDAAHIPYSYRKFVSERDAEGSYYKELLDSNPTRPKILINKRDVEKKFKGIGDKNYSQYIALPISCKGKAIGLLQITAYNNSVLSTQEAEIKRFCNDYFSIAANAMLLTDKNENITQII